MRTIQIGGVTIEQTAALAPMASVADHPYRVLCREYGAAYLVGEMTSCKGLCFGDQKSAELLTVTDAERPMAVQLFGDDPAYMARAAEKCLAYRPDIIDINMGCPVPKVAGNGSGAALMKTPALAGEIVRAVSDAVSIPVTVKIRKGWDEAHVNAVEFAKRMEQNGAAAITVHGRTRAQMYAPPADLAIIRAVKEAVSVPVIGNGDVDSIDSCVRMYEETGCDLVMIGRGSYGRPWLFAQIRAYLETGERLPDPPVAARMSVMRRQIEMLCAEKGERIGMQEARSHASRYMHGLRGAADLRRRCGTLSSMDDLEQLIASILLAADDISGTSAQ